MTIMYLLLTFLFALKTKLIASVPALGHLNRQIRYLRKSYVPAAYL